MALHFLFSFDIRSTTDIDYYQRDTTIQSLLDEAIIGVSTDYKIPEDWMNNHLLDIKETNHLMETLEVYSDTTMFKIAQMATYYDSFNGILNIFIPNELDLLCTKLKAGRDKDTKDIEFLSTYLSLRCDVFFTDVIDRFNDIFDGKFNVQSKITAYYKAMGIFSKNKRLTRN